MKAYRFHAFQCGLPVADLGRRNFDAPSHAHEAGLRLAAVALATSTERPNVAPLNAEIRIYDDADLPIAIVAIEQSLRLLDPSRGGESKRAFDRLIRRARRAELSAGLAWLEAIRAEQELSRIKALAQQLLDQPVYPLGRG